MGKWRWGIVLDAGSSGTRIHIYRWLKPKKAKKKASKEELGGLPVIDDGISAGEKNWIKKIHPGIATYGDAPEDVGPEYLHQLFDHAATVIPHDELENTPVFLLATAGMRLLEEYKRRKLLEQICSYAKKNTKFQLPDCDLHVQVIPGETEGLYGWIAANYLLGGFDKPAEHDHGKDHHTYGFLDMGGASAQIAFAPNSTEAAKHANDLKLLRMRNVDGTQAEYKVFVTTWLGFGVNEARKRYVDRMMEAMPGTMEIPDPCLPNGLVVTTEGKRIKPGSPEDNKDTLRIAGTGEFEECLSSVNPLLDKDAVCQDPPCLLHGSHVPAIDFDVNHFVGVSEYWHTTHEIFEFAHKDKAYDFHTYQKRVNEFCSMSWEEISKGVKKEKWGDKVKEQKAAEVCFKASWLINVLHDGIGVPRVGHENLNTGFNGTQEVLDKAKDRGYLEYFQAVNKLSGHEVSWTLGKMVLYASSEIPPASDATLAVGFGTNEPGSATSSDFQYAGGSPMSYPKGDDDDDDWHDTLFTDSPRRIPGIIIFLFILLVAALVLCGRDRRTTAWHRVRRVLPGSRGHSSGPGLGKRKRGPGLRLNLASKLFGSSSHNHHGAGPAYERVLEDGPTAADFELPEMTPGQGYYSDQEHFSDGSDGPGGEVRVGRTSGWATPQTKTFEGLTPGYFDVGGGSSYAGSVSGVSSGPPSVVGNAISRGGLMARVESRERLSLEPSASERGKSAVRGMGLGRGSSRASSPSKLRSFKESLD